MDPVGWFPMPRLKGSKAGDDKLLESPGLKAGHDQLRVFLQQEKDHSIDSILFYDPALRAARGVWLRHFMFPVFVPTVLTMAFTVRKATHPRLKIAVGAFSLWFGAVLFRREFGLYNLSVERTVKVLELNTPLAARIRERVKEAEPSHWTLQKYSKLRAMENEKSEASKQKKQEQKDRWYYSNKLRRREKADGFAKQWFRTKWEADYVPLNPDVVLTQQTKDSLKRTQEGIVHNYEALKAQLGEEQLAELSLGDVVTRDTSRFLPEYPLPTEELSFASRVADDLAQVSKEQSDARDEAQQRKDFPELCDSHYAWRPQTRVMRKEWYPKALVASDARKNADDNLWLREFGVIDEDTKEWLLQPAEPDSVFEDCWKVEEEYNRCKRLHSFDKVKCAKLKKQAKRCRALDYMAKVKDLR